VTRRRVRATALCVGAFALLAALLVSLAGGFPGLQTRADLGQFDPGDIISDAVFWDSSTMTEADIQAFLNVKGVNCQTSNVWCIKNLRQDTYTRSSPQPSTAGCAGDYIGARSESAATILYKVSRACGINPAVLIVTLQKEAGAITAKSPTEGKYKNVMGFGCPDTAPCANTDNGFFNQVYKAANQFQRYKAGAAGSIRPFRTTNIGYYPAVIDDFGDNRNNVRCGTQAVYVQNYATAALYNYTPYVPNRAALDNEYAEGNSCSAYGNRNFYSYFTDWFDGAQSIRDRAATAGLGAVLNPVWCDQPGGGCRQRFAGGDIYWSPTTGAHAVKGAILTTFYASGGPVYMGYPTGEEGQDAKAPGTYYSNFERGDIVWNRAVGARMVRGEILKRWQQSGAASGTLGLPTGDDTLVANGSMTSFQGGTVYWSQGTGARVVKGAILNRYQAMGGPGNFGFPTGEEGQDPKSPGTYYSNFERGDIVWNAAVGAHNVSGPLLDRWRAAGAAGGSLGLPTGDDTHVAYGSVSTFQKGAVYWSQGTGARVVRGPILDRYRAMGGPGAFGFPTGEEGQDAKSAGTAYSNFERGDIIWNSAVGAHDVWGPLLDRWRAAGAAAGSLGLPTGDDTHVANGSMTSFQKGNVFWSQGTGARVVQGAVLTRYLAVGGPVAIGFPTAEEGADPASPGTTWSSFGSGDIVANPSTGAHLVRGEVLQRWRALGATSGPLGLPTGDDTAITGGSVSTFQNGNVYWSKATGAHAVLGPILAKYTEPGVSGLLGFPTGEQGEDPRARGVTYSNFQSGDIIWSEPTGAHHVRGGILRTWQANGAAGGPLGAPTADEATAPNGGYVSAFTGGSIYWSPATSMKVLRGDVLARYREMGGPASLLGYPTRDSASTPGAAGSYANFQGGDLIWSAATGAHYVRGGILRTWQDNGAAAGSLGFPTADEAAAPNGGFVSEFQKGSIYWSQATSMHVVRGPVLDKYRELGGPGGLLGYPTVDHATITATSTTPAGATAGFQGGDVFWSLDSGAHLVRGGILSTYRGNGGPTGSLGFPTEDEAATPNGGYVSAFKGGSVYWSQATSMKVLRGPVLAKYVAMQGPGGPLGFPTTDSAPTPGVEGTYADFQKGAVYSTPTSRDGAHAVLEPVNAAYRQAGGPSSSFGFPVSDSRPVDASRPDQGPFVADFQNGQITR
jgi:uncharacterized protein with LGFP repeats